MISMVPAMACNHFPRYENESIAAYFDALNLDESKMIGFAHPYNWVFRDTFRLIDDGGVYRVQDPIQGSPIPPTKHEIRC